MSTLHPQITTYRLPFSNLPATFDGFRILLISDVHGEKVILPKRELDLVAITGDLVDSRRGGMGNALSLGEAAARLAPTYYVPGNHESRLPDYGRLAAALEQRGVTLLEDRKEVLSLADGSIDLLGLRDPAFSGGAERMEHILQQLQRPERFQLLLSHRPEYFDLYTRHGISLTLSGHTHGGQIRLPFLGGLFAPNQGVLPKWDAGVFREGTSTLVVSRGLGNSIAPLRLFNPPELVEIILEKA